MFDVAPSELLFVALIALVVIGPKDLPRVMRTVGRWVGRIRDVARQFRSGFDEMVRESELREMEERWRAENERIMREHPAIPDASEPKAIEAPAVPYPTAKSDASDPAISPASETDTPPTNGAKS